jgi:putative hemolysin
MEIIIIILLIVLNGVFALAEIAFVSANTGKLRESAGANKTARYLLALKKEPQKFLSTIQVSITLIGIVAGLYSGLTLADDLSLLIRHVPYVSHYAYQISLVLLVLVVTYFSIVFGELIPKTFALRHPERSILALINFVRIISIILFPFVAVLSFSVDLFFKVTGLKTGRDDQEIDIVTQILGATRLAVTERRIEMEQEKIIKKAILINKIKVSEILVEKKNIKYLYSDMTLVDALLEAHVHQHTRYPVFDRANDETIGYINFKDIINVLKFNPKDPSLLSICRPILRLSEQEFIIDALKAMTKNFQHIALIVDVQNRERGLITLEDIIEILVGDLTEEFESIPDYAYKIAGYRYIAGGRITLAKLYALGMASIPKLDVSLNDWLLQHFGKVVMTDSKKEIDGVVFIVKKIRHSKIFEVIIELPERGTEQ